MNDHMLNLRRFFRNRFEHYMDMNDSTATTELDGSRLTLRDLCSLLADDPELFPRYYDRDMRRVCGYHYRAWLRGSRTYGDAARVLGRLLATEDGDLPRPNGIWVNELLNGNSITLRE